jgi:hypothetical protein
VTFYSFSYILPSPPGSVPTCKYRLRRHRFPLFRAFFSYFINHQRLLISSHNQATEGVSASYDALLELFESIGNFLKRLELYTKVSLSTLMTEIIVKIMVELLSILAQAKKQIKHGRLSAPLPRLSLTVPELTAEQFAKKLLGDSEIENILRRLDRLTQDEVRMTEARILEVVHGLMNNMKVVMDGERSPFVPSL